MTLIALSTSSHSATSTLALLASPSTMSSKKTVAQDAMLMDFGNLSHQELQARARGGQADRAKSLRKVQDITSEDALAQAPLTLFEHLFCILFLAYGPPNGVFTFPATLLGVGLVRGDITQTFLYAGAFFFLPLILIPQPFLRNMTESWASWVVLKYFSMKLITEEDFGVAPEKRRIMVAPPHGVFAYGNVLAIQCWPSRFGFPFRGLAASSALRVPVFKQYLRSIGVVDASRHVARRAVEVDFSIGISTGGVAEVFETNADDECILLKERIGMIKLAIRTGSDIVPCYLFGNTKLLKCWAGEGIPGAREILEYVSRKLGFALIFIYGRFGLPVPFRLPVLGIVGKGISTVQKKEPTMEEVYEIQEKLFAEMRRIFDTYKGLYGWKDKKLIIK